MANFNFNKVILGGRLTADPELKTTPSGTVVTSFSIAVNRRFGGKNGEEPQVDFINVTAWRQTAEFITRYFRKGSSICVVGSIQTRKWNDQQGNKRVSTEVVADEAMFVDSKNDGPAASTGAPAYGQATSYMPEGYSSFGGQGGAPVYNNAGGATAPKFEEFTDDDDLPF